jgi:hypothetical protein
MYCTTYPIYFDEKTAITTSTVICFLIVSHFFSKSFIEDYLVPKMLKFGQRHLDVLNLKPFEEDLTLYNSMKYKTIQMLNVLYYESINKPEEFNDYIYRRVSKYAIVNIIPLLIINRIIKKMFKD